MRYIDTREELEDRAQAAKKRFVADDDAVQAAHDGREDWERTGLYHHALLGSAGLFIKPPGFNGVISGPIDEVYSDLVGNQYTQSELNKIAVDREGDKIKNSRIHSAEWELQNQKGAFLNEALSWTGERYDEDRTPKEFCAVIRRVIKQGVKDGVLPMPADYRVSSRGTGYYEDRLYIIRTYHGDSAFLDQLHKLLLPYQKCSVSTMDGYGNQCLDENYSHNLCSSVPISAASRQMAKERRRAGKNRAPIDEYMMLSFKLDIDEMIKRGFSEAQIIGEFSTLSSEDEKREVTEYVKEKT